MVITDKSHYPQTTAWREEEQKEMLGNGVEENILNWSWVIPTTYSQLKIVKILVDAPQLQSLVKDEPI